MRSSSGAGGEPGIESAVESSQGSLFGQRVKKACQALGITPNAAASQAGVNISNFHAALRGTDRFPSPADLERLAPIIKVPVQELQGLVDADRLGPERLGNLLQAVEAPPTARDHEHYAGPGADYPAGYKPVEADDVGSLFGAYVLNRLAMMGRNSSWLAVAARIDPGDMEKAIRGRQALTPLEVRTIAQHLHVPEEELLRAASASAPSQDRLPGVPVQLAMLQIPVDVPDLPDTWELEVLKKISAMDFGDLDPRRDVHFWYWPRAERRSALQHFEALWAAQQGRKGKGNDDVSR